MNNSGGSRETVNKTFLPHVVDFLPDTTFQKSSKAVKRDCILPHPRQTLSDEFID
jgi:hypothetical protein